MPGSGTDDVTNGTEDMVSPNRFGQGYAAGGGNGTGSLSVVDLWAVDLSIGRFFG
jgi:hypothetical protein